MRNVEAASILHEKWQFRSEDDINEWNAAGVGQGTLENGRLVFSVEKQAALFRPLPEGFAQNVDAMRIQYDGSDLDEVALLFLTIGDDGKIARRFRLVVPQTTGTGGEYIPLSWYRRDVEDASVIAVSFIGDSERTELGDARFIRYTLSSKIAAIWQSFWTFEPFNAHTINIILGPAISTDMEKVGEILDWQVYATSVNAYLLAGLALFGFGLLFLAWWKRERTNADWMTLKRMILTRFFIVLSAVWFIYDFRMGWEFISSVALDHVQYVEASPEDRVFRDRGRFYDFAEFVKPLVADRERYELFLPQSWPYFGSMRYTTYPAMPNPEAAQVSDTWVIYDRADITVEDGVLMRNGEAFSKPGTVLGRLDQYSFVFRES